MIEWQKVDETPPDHPWPDNNPEDYCAQCGQSWLAHDGNASKILDQMARLWP